MTSNPIHRPQGYSWERFGTEPSPFTNRIPMSTTPRAMIDPVIALNGVRIGPLGLSSPRRNTATLFASSDIFWVCPLNRMILPFIVVSPCADMVDAEEERGPQDEDQGYPVQKSRRELRIGGRSEVRFEAELLEWNAGEVQHPGASHLVLPVDVVDIGVRVPVDARLGLLDKVPSFAEEKGRCGAGLDAGGLLALLLPLVAELALPDPGIG